MSEATRMFLWVLTFVIILGGLIWLVALADYVLNHNQSATGPLIGIPVGIVAWSPLLYIICRIMYPTTSKKETTL